MLDRQVAEPGPELGALARHLWYPSKPPVVDHLRHEAADVRVHPARAVEEHPHVRRHCRVLTQQVLEDRGFGPGWMRPLRHLRELQRVAQEDYVAGRCRHGERVGKRDLPRFVDDKVVDARTARAGSIKVRVSEQP